MYTTRIANLKPAPWFNWIISILLLLFVLYGLLHFLHPTGRSTTKLTVSDIATISALLYERSGPAGVSTIPATSSTITGSKSESANIGDLIPDSQRLLTNVQRSVVAKYISSSYRMNATDADSLRAWVALFDRPANLMNSLKDHIFMVESFFWLTGGWLFVEVLFWTWFGLIASLLYNVSEALRQGQNKFATNEVWVHIAKFFYSPLCSIAFFLGLNLAITDQKVLDLVNLSPNQIIVAFILGFFSGRVVELLQRIKNLIFPDSTSLSANPGMPVTQVSTSTSVANFTLAIADVEQAIQDNGAFWLKAYPNVTGLAAQIKKTANQPTGQVSILFEVVKKVPNLTVGQIPPAFSVTTRDGRQLVIPTDVEGVGITRFSYQDGQPEIHLDLSTAALGGSVAAKNRPDNWGTMGLRVHDTNNQYVLTCCHVMCGDLIRDDQMINGVWTYNRQRDGVISAIVPGGPGNQGMIGEVWMASFSSKEDFALIKLDNQVDVSPHLATQIGGLDDIQLQLGASIMHRTAFMVGACSNEQRAEIVASYQEGEYTNIPNLNSARMEGLVKIDLLSKGGDSGAAVYIQDDDQKLIIGLLIADNEEASYILPVSEYLTNNGLQLTI